MSNITFNKEKLRIIYNFSNNIDIKINTNYGEEIRMIADYRYDDFYNEMEFNQKKIELRERVKSLGFIIPDSPYHHWVNPKHITFVNVDYKKTRIIFNLANSITKPIGGEMMLVNDFVFWDYSTEEELNEAIKQVFNLIQEEK